MKIAVFSDVHGNLPALEALYRDIQGQAVDAVYCLGDLVGFGSCPNEVIQFIRENHIPTVFGEYDEAAAFHLPDPGMRTDVEASSGSDSASFEWTKAALTEASRSFLQTLPMQIRFTVGSKRVLLVHGSPRRVDEYLSPGLPEATIAALSRLAGCEVLCVGHTHQAGQIRSGSTTIINPGSAGLGLQGGHTAVYAVLELGWRLQVSFHRVDYDVQLAGEASFSQDKTVTPAGS